MASHELKTPLTSMKLYLDYLSGAIKKESHPKEFKTLKNIKDQTEKLQKLVNDLLDVSRLQTGKLNFDKENFRLDSLIKECVEDLQRVSKHEFKLAKLPDLTVYGDRFRIYQVLTNLLTNAIKYSPDDKGIIINMKKNDNRALVSVQDYGIGIDKSEQKKIFERLYQVADDKEKTFPGFGMGLYISKEIIKRHSGSIWVESEKGRGSSFFFTLPLAKKN